MNPFEILIGEEVRNALDARLPVVALESTIICHGMPHPVNVETARRLQEAIRAEGAVPATVAVLDGRLKIGIDADEIERLARKGREVAKASRRDLPFLVAGSMDGATTVAATMIACALARISVFATGGIGGVHRGVEETMDISADLQELAKTNVAVVCSGIKSVLDIPRTLEHLETLGVPVAAYQTGTLPAFYSPSSGLTVDYRFDTPLEAASAMHAKWSLGLEGGMLIAVPVPEPHGIASEEIEAVIEETLHRMRQERVSGKAITPYLLDRIAEKTGGRSLKANVELVVNNARVAARIAGQYAKLRAGDHRAKPDQASD